MDFYLLLKTWIKMSVINTVKNFLIVQKKSTADARKTASKREIQKTVGVTGDLIGNKIADKITSFSTEMKKKLLLKKDTYHQKKDKFLMN